ncbi:complex I subunit 5 family protein [Ancylobacter terrae]|uniref:complex I subunit 5 family protein n=1 Tax=Ancylobacter sp. sgz301288 TaxID=3342077 RepID=UPI00385EAD9F
MSEAAGPGFLLVLAVMLPVIGILVMLAGLARPARVALVIVPAGIAVALAIAIEVIRTETALAYALGGWQPPLGISLRADGLAAVLLLMTAVVIGGVALFAAAPFGGDRDGRPDRAPLTFWTLLLGLWSALAVAFLSQDLFNLFVALELLTFSAVPLVCLDGRAATLRAALRYLVFALLGSVLYLLGAALLYGAYGTLDIARLHALARGDLATSLAVALMIVGLIAKTALFPLHLWLPPAHAGAPAAASAVLSALVVKAPFVIILRLWFEVLPIGSPEGAQILALLGAAAILFCSVLALRQARLKLLIAYSTLAQIGYLFLIFPLAAATPTLAPWETIGWAGGILQLVSHAFAKAAMFMAAGLITEALGHDRIEGLPGAGRLVPMSVFAFALGGLSLMGLPPSGGFNAKCMLLMAAVTQGEWWIAAVILSGGVLAAGYVFKVIGRAMATPVEALSPRAPVPRMRQAVALALALAATALGFAPLQPYGVLAIGRGGPPALTEAMPPAMMPSSAVTP